MMMIHLLLFVSCLLAVTIDASTLDHNLDRDWKLFQSTHGKNYGSVVEVAQRRAIWEKNLDIIKRHNAEYALGFHSYTMGMNTYGDMTADEFTFTLGSAGDQEIKTLRHVVYSRVNANDLPDEVDWRKKGYVTGVKDQGQLDSNWAFSATGAIEGQMFNKTRKLVSLSEENIVDCTGNADTVVGPGLGLMDYAFQYVMDNGGLDSEECYPKMTKGRCMYNPDCSAADVVSFHDIPTGDELALQQAVATIGPVSVAIDASQLSFQLYSGGIYDSTVCGSHYNHLNHGVLAVGYGTINGKDYWLVKNSWGISWGDQGYIMMSRNKNNQCGIATASSYPLS